MNKIGEKELKKIEIGILDCIDKFCEKNNIKYWIDYGTLLGAVRHKGFIPWDDDIDIGMLREDYEKFMKSFNSFNSKYKFNCFENNNEWNYLYGKVFDTDTILYEPNKESGYETSVFVDVFIYDYAPDDNKISNKYFKKRDFLSKLNKLQLYNNFYNIYKRKYNFIRYPFHLIANIFPKRFFLKKMIKNNKKIAVNKTDFVGSFSATEHMICNKKIFDSTIKMEFEGKKYPIPVGYDELLKLYYGDYMQLPPKEKQISNHVFEAYYKLGKKDGER